MRRPHRLQRRHSCTRPHDLVHGHADAGAAADVPGHRGGTPDVGRIAPPNFTEIHVAPSPVPLDDKFYCVCHCAANQTEVLLLATLLVIHFNKPREDGLTLATWLKGVSTDAVRIDRLGYRWVPLATGDWNSKGLIQSELEKSLRTDVIVSGGDGAVETAARVVQTWQASHGAAILQPSEISTYLKGLREKTGSKRKLMGPLRDDRGSASSRWVSAIPAVAAFLGAHGRPLSRAVERHTVERDGDAVMTKAEVADSMEELKVEHAGELAAERAKTRAAEVKAVAKQAKLDTAIKAKSKAQTAKAQTDATKKGTAKRVRDEEKAKAKEREAAIRETAAEQADEALKTKVKAKQACATAAHGVKRYWKGRCENAEHLAETRGEELKKLKEDNASLTHDRNELMMDAEEEEGELHEKHLQAWARQQAMPRWRAPTAPRAEAAGHNDQGSLGGGAARARAAEARRARRGGRDRRGRRRAARGRTDARRLDGRHRAGGMLALLAAAD